MLSLIVANKKPKIVIFSLEPSKKWIFSMAETNLNSIKNIMKLYFDLSTMGTSKMLRKEIQLQIIKKRWLN